MAVRFREIAVRPLHDKTFVKRVRPRPRPPGGIFLPETSKDNKPKTGTIKPWATGASTPRPAAHPASPVKKRATRSSSHSGTEVQDQRARNC